MISAGDIRKGTTFEFDGQVFTVLEFLHVKPGKGAAFVRTKLRNVITGGVTDKTFNPTEKLLVLRKIVFLIIQPNLLPKLDITKLCKW